MRLLASVSIMAMLALAACQARTPVELPEPTADSAVMYFVGTPLSGPTSRPAGTATFPFRAEDLLGVRVTMIELERMPHDALEPLGAHARLIAVSRGDQPVLATARLTLDARYGRFPSPVSPLQLADILPPAATGRTRTIYDLRGVLPAGVTASFLAIDRFWVADPLSRKPVQRNLHVDLHRSEAAAGDLQVALSLQDAPPTSRASDTPHNLQRETVLVDPPDGPCLMLIAPFVFTDSPAKAVAILIEITRDPGTEYTAAIEACQHDLANPAALPPATIQSFDWTISAITAAMDELQRPERRRASLVFLGDQTGAQILPDLALVADDAVLARLVVQFHDQTVPASSTLDKQALGWQLDLATLELLRDMQTAGQFPREFTAVLLTHTGEAGRHASSLEEILNGLSSRAELQRRLIAENTQYLEDGSPASRIRAYDWLRARQKDPPGYDPLASPKERRDAVEKALHPSTTGGTP